MWKVSRSISIPSSPPRKFQEAWYLYPGNSQHGDLDVITVPQDRCVVQADGTISTLPRLVVMDSMVLVGRNTRNRIFS